MNSSKDHKKKTNLLLTSKDLSFEIEDSVYEECMRTNPYVYEHFGIGTPILTRSNIKVIEYHRRKRDDDDDDDDDSNKSSAGIFFIDLMDYEDEFVRVEKKMEVSHKELYDLIVAATGIDWIYPSAAT